MKKSFLNPLLLPLLVLLSCGGASKKQGPVRSGLQEYADQARLYRVENREGEGSLWAQTSLSDGFRDLRAYRAGDIVTIQVLESTSAVSEATTASVRSSQAGEKDAALFGLERGIKELPNLLDLNRSTEFTGDASTTRRSVLQTSISARVVEVFPNGFLLLEGNREIMINNERQIVTVRGIVRPQDISPFNVVRSSNIAELEVEVQGRGVVSEAQKPGILFRILSGFWPF